MKLYTLWMIVQSALPPGEVLEVKEVEPTLMKAEECNLKQMGRFSFVSDGKIVTYVCKEAQWIV